MSAREFTWTPTDRAHELAGEADEDFETQLAKVTKRHAAAMRTNALTGHQQTLSDLAESLAHRFTQREIVDGVESECDNLANLIRTALSCGVHTAGNRLLDMIDNCIEDDAETAALVEMDRDERARAGGLDVVAMRAVASQDVRVSL